MASTHHICWVKVDKCYNIPHPNEPFQTFFFWGGGAGYGTTESSLKIAPPLAIAFPSHHSLDNNTLQVSSLQALSSKCQG